MDGMTSELLNGLAKSIWLWCRKQNIVLSAQHVPGIENVTAGYKSRIFNDTNEWMLKKDIFVRICSQFFNPDIDIFVSRLNHQIDNYASWSYDPEASSMDAFTISWKDLHPYLFPPFTIIPRILSKIKTDTVDKAIIIVPLWPSQLWFPLLISLIVSFPLRLPGHNDLISMPSTGLLHPLTKKADFAAVQLSGNP
jgi:hypothetical protein